MTAPRWEPITSDTANLLTLVSDPGHPSADAEWRIFTEAIVTASLFDGIVRPNDLRPLIRGRVAPKRIGAFVNRALAEGLIEWRGEWEVSNDREGRNSGRPAKVYVRPRGAA